MNMKIMFCIAIFLSLVAIRTQGNTMGDDIQKRVDALIAKIKNYEIARVEIFNIPPEVLTRTRLSPEMIEKQYNYKFVIRDVRNTACRNKFIEAIESISVKPLSEIPDLRWGVIFYGVDDKRLEAIYFDKTGSKGSIGDSPVSFKGNFFKWLVVNFPSFKQ